MTRRAVVVLAAAAVLALGGCGGGGGSERTGETFATAPPATTTTVALVGGAGQAVTTAPAPPPASIRGFRSPTGNIGCMLEPTLARCDIRERSYAPPPKPAGCDLEWGDAIEVSDRGPAHFLCHGDTAFDPAAPVLAYGQEAQAGSIVCRSEFSGMTCEHRPTATGFVLSRENYRIY